MNIYGLLGLRSGATPEEVKTRYYKRLAEVHPNSRVEGSTASFIALTNAYKQYTLGEDAADCFCVCASNTGHVRCRCGGVYDVAPHELGKMECNYCSCFIFVEEAPRELCGPSSPDASNKYEN